MNEPLFKILTEVLFLLIGKIHRKSYFIDNIIKLNDEEKNKIVLDQFEEAVEMKFTFEETNYAQVLRRNAMEKGIYMVAKNMLKEGVLIELISKTTSLSREKIVEISKLKA